jgi:hypothetical protein
MKRPHLLLPLTLALTLLACTRTAPVPAFNSDSVVTAIRDSLSLRYGSEEDLQAALWNQRLVVEAIPNSKYGGPNSYNIAVQKAALYPSEETVGKPLDSLPLGSHLAIAPEPYRRRDAYYVQQAERVMTQDGVIGFVKYAELGTHKFGNILVGNDYGLRQGNRCNVVLYDPNPPKIMDTLSFSWHGGEGGSFANVRYIPNLALKNVVGAIRFDGSNAACPEYHQMHYIVQSKGKLRDIIQGFSTGEGGDNTGGYYSEANIYLPIRFENGNIHLISDGDVYRVFSQKTMGVNAFEYNDSIGIPIDQLVVVAEEAAEYVEAYPTQDVTDKYGPHKKIVSHHRVKYYCWDGEQLNFVKQSN